jgi:uncharacterized membrane protein YvlD (DUF360 family)
MLKMLIHWLLSAVVLLIIAHFVPGFHVASMQTAFIAALVIGLLNATLGFFLKIITFPITILTLGLFLLVINASKQSFQSIGHACSVRVFAPARMAAGRPGHQLSEPRGRFSLQIYIDFAVSSDAGK